MFAFLGHTTDTKLVIKSNNNTPKVNDFLSAWLAEHDRTQRDGERRYEERHEVGERATNKNFDKGNSCC